MAAAGKTPAVITLDWRHLSSDATGRSTLAAPRTDALDRLTAQPLADEELVLVRLSSPTTTSPHRRVRCWSIRDTRTAEPSS